MLAHSNVSEKLLLSAVPMYVDTTQASNSRLPSAAHPVHCSSLPAAHPLAITQVATMLDTKGPEIRTGFFEAGGSIDLVAGQELVITTDYEVCAHAPHPAWAHLCYPADTPPSCTRIARTVPSYPSLF